jgi:hypothetical protein
MTTDSDHKITYGETHNDGSGLCGARKKRIGLVSETAHHVYVHTEEMPPEHESVLRQYWLHKNPEGE